MPKTLCLASLFLAFTTSPKLSGKLMLLCYIYLYCLGNLMVHVAGLSVSITILRFLCHLGFFKNMIILHLLYN